MKKVAFYTLGCKVNQYETEAMLEMFKKDGYTQVESEEFADVYVINTCTVTHMSDRKSRQYIRRMKKKNPDAIIAVVGCYSQVSPEEILEIEEVNLVMGTNERRQIVEEIKKLDATKKASTVDDIMKVRAFEEIEINQTNGRTRAFMKIQDGCDRFCTYCIIPYARGGKVRSRDLESIVNEAKKLADNGYKEIVLTGIHVASYGKDFENNYDLISLLEDINKIEGIERIRLGSIEPLWLTTEVLERLINNVNKFCPHFHLSLQSACTETLKRMNRRYTIEEFKDIVNKIRKYYKNPVLTTDIIVGFPEETDEEFEITYNNLKEIAFYKMHVFKYSPRKGTVAAKLKGQISGDIKDERSKKLLNMSDEFEKMYQEKYIGLDVNVLVEEQDEQGFFRGHTSNYIMVKVKSNIDLCNKIINVKIKEIDDFILVGEMM